MKNEYSKCSAAMTSQNFPSSATTMWQTTFPRSLHRCGSFRKIVIIQSVSIRTSQQSFPPKLNTDQANNNNKPLLSNSGCLQIVWESVGPFVETCAITTPLVAWQKAKTILESHCQALLGLLLLLACCIVPKPTNASCLCIPSIHLP